MNEEFGLSLINLLVRVFYIVYLMLVVFVPFILGTIFWKLWVKYVRLKFLTSQEHVLLEFRLPKEILKSPLAMEVFLTTLYQTGSESTWWDKYWTGGMRAWFSLELVSIEGQVHFFVWTRKGFIKAIETQLYSQYPDVEIAQVDDYAQDFEFEPGKNDVYGTYFRKDKDSHYPIKTYVDFGLDKDPKEELKIDPMTPILEFLGSLGRGEQGWIQIIIRAHKKEMPKPGTWFGKVDWKHFATEEIAKKMQRNKGEGQTGDRLTKGEKLAVEAIERAVSKFAFDTGIRAIYLAEKQYFNKGNVPGFRGIFRQFSSNDLNSLVPKDGTSFDYPWQDFGDYRLNKLKNKLVETYKQRAFFKPGHTVKYAKPSVLNVEELASIYHFPGKVASTPTFSRIPSKKSEPPANLPV